MIHLIVGVAFGVAFGIVLGNYLLGLLQHWAAYRTEKRDLRIVEARIRQLGPPPGNGPWFG
jgi:hypothetical protein